MFSQLRHAVESLAPQPLRGFEIHDQSLDGSGVENGTQDLSSRSGSLDLPAIRASTSNFRKPQITQRSSSPVSKASTSLTECETRSQKYNLEERLRATFAIGDASNVPTPDLSTRASPSPQRDPMDHHSSLLSNPLPVSPAVASDENESHLTSSLVPLVLQEDQIKPETWPLLSVEETNIPVVPVKNQGPSQNFHLDVLSQLATIPYVESDDNVDYLQERIKFIEQRFPEVYASFKGLQADKFAADELLHDLTSVDSWKDTEALRNYLQNLVIRTKISRDEIIRLNGKITRQDERIEELRDIHRLESASQSDQIEKLRKQLIETEDLLSASQDSVLRKEDELHQKIIEIQKLNAEVTCSKGLAKEEEEKRVKAISLLKTVRQKLVKAEKEKDDAIKELGVFKEKEKAERDKDRLERTKLQDEINAVNAEREKAVSGLRAQFDKEVANIKERNEREMSALKGQIELEIVTTKSAHLKELDDKVAQISSLELFMNNLSRDKNMFFDQLQLRKAELESSQSHLEALQSHNTELEFQLRETNECLIILQDDIAEAHRNQDCRSVGPQASAEDVAHLLSAAGAKYESKIADLKRNIAVIEKERDEGEAEWSLKLRDKVREAEDLKRALETSTNVKEQNEVVVRDLKAEIGYLQEVLEHHREQIATLRLQTDLVKDLENSAQANVPGLIAKIAVLERQSDDNKSREAQLRSSNKTLKEELRKVQSSAALLERQRNPGIRSWTSPSENISTNPPISNSSCTSDLLSQCGSPSSPSSTRNDEVNLEYLRNVILQFLEHKEMRPNLVKVLSIILQFTPQETRRLIAKV